jgi:hypothetical protein
MKKKNKIRLDIVLLIFTLIITIFSAVPFYSEQTDAKLFALVFGSFGTGAMLSNLIHDVRRKRDDK